MRLINPALGLVVIATMVVGLAVVARPAAAATDPPAAASQFFDLLNRARIDRGQPAVTRDVGLDNVAIDWATRMQGVYAKTQTITGTGDCSTHALCHRPNLASAVSAVEPAWAAAAENIGTDFGVDSLNTEFMDSPDHLADIVGDYNRVGIGVANDGDGRIWVSVVFLKGPILGPSETTQSQPAAHAPHAALVTLGSNARFSPVIPTRVADTRSTGALEANNVLVLQLAANGFVDVSATSAKLNVTAIGSHADGFLTAYPCGRAAPDVSSVNYVVGQAVPNLVTVALGTGGTVCIVASTTANIIADLEGSYGSVSTGQNYTPAAAQRLLDSRPTGRSTTFKVSIAASVGAGAVAVTLNATVQGPAGGGFLTAYPCGIEAPNTSNLNFEAGQTVANEMTVRIGSGRAVCFVSTVATNLIVDFSGSFSPSGSPLTTVVPSRFLDTRFGVGGWIGRLGAGQTVDFALAGAAGIPSGTAAVVLNVTVTGAAAAGFLTVYPCDQTRPDASNLNFIPGRAVANGVTVKLATNGRLCVYSSSRSDVLVDLAGYLGG